MHERYIAIIVDAYSTGKHLAQELEKYGLKCIHIKSSKNLPAKFVHKKTHFVENLDFDGDVQDIKKMKTFVESLKKLETENNYRFVLCVPGSESGVELADALSEGLGLISNGTELSPARRDKYLMTQMAQKAGIKTAKHFKSKDVNEIAEWGRREGGYPLVLKARASASNHQVYICNNLEEMTEASNDILGSPNLFGQPNEEVLAQSFIYGKEYIVNTVSWEGRHYLAEIWRITKKPNTIIYDKAEIVHDHEKEFAPLFESTKKVLDALGIRYGAGTTEWKYTPDGGPVLIESASRLMGGAQIDFSQKLIGFSQLSLMVEAYLTPDIFLERLVKARPKTLNEKEEMQYGMAVVLISGVEGDLKTDIDMSAFSKLETLFGQPIIGFQKGDHLKRTTNYLTAPGEIYLLSTDPKKLSSDYSKIRQMEQQGLYRNAVHGTPFLFWKEKHMKASSIQTHNTDENKNTIMPSLPQPSAQFQ